MREVWADVPLVTIELPHCPICLGGDPLIVRSEKNGDGSFTRKCICRHCSERFKIVFELPESGNDQFPLL